MYSTLLAYRSEVPAYQVLEEYLLPRLLPPLVHPVRNILNWNKLSTLVCGYAETFWKYDFNWYEDMNGVLKIMRINFSHATYEEADLRMRNLRLCKGLSALDTNVWHKYLFSFHKIRRKFLFSQNREPVLNVRGVMLDTQGPEIRTGSWGSTSKEEEFIVGQKVIVQLKR